MRGPAHGTIPDYLGACISAAKGSAGEEGEDTDTASNIAKIVAMTNVASSKRMGHGRTVRIHYNAKAHLANG